MTRPAEVVLSEITRLLLDWKPDADTRIARLRKDLEATYPELSATANDLVVKRKPALALLKAAYQEGGGSRNKSWPDLMVEANQLAMPNLVVAMEKQRAVGQTAKQRYKRDRDLAKNGKALSTVAPRPNTASQVQPVAGGTTNRVAPQPPTPMHPNDVRSLRPQPAWTLLLDETGSNFDGAAISPDGKFVGLLVSQGKPGLASLKAGWHAVDCPDPGEIDVAVQHVLDAPCGVIGFPVSALPNSTGERWLDGMRALVDWVLRLLPLDGPTKLEVAIEARPPYRPGMEPDAICRDALAMLARAWPERAGLIDLRISTQPKDGHPLLAYVDSLAFTWGSKAQSSRERLDRSGLLDTCLLNFSASELAACWDAWDQPGGLSPANWATLVTTPEARNPASITSAILSALAQVSRSDKRRWQGYLAETQRHLFGGTFQLERVNAMVDWLEQAKPAEENIPDTLRLVWLTVALARANHLGVTSEEGAWLAELGKLSTSLHDEAAPLCCHADLHRAVASTNRFDFDGASGVLESWCGKPPAIPGLRFWAQCHSSIGQHFAFRGDQTGAMRAFATALESFSRLTDPGMRHKEIDQTSCYAAIAAMDGGLDDVSAKAALVAYLGDPTDVVATLASSSEIEHYRHHTLLRWIVSRNDKTLRDAYLAQRESWNSGVSHPWPLIEIYRALLLYPEDKKGAIEHARTAAAIAFSAQQGPTVRLIGACCRAIGVAWGDAWHEAESILSELRETLPHARKRLERLSLFLETPSDPLALLSETLPFNFR